MKQTLLAAVLCALSALSIHAQEEPTPTPEPKVVQSSAKDELVALAGQTATVEGKVTRIGATSGGGITFINMAPGANGFVAVVFKSSYEAFPGGFDSYKDKTLRVTGRIELYKEATPQIVVKTPGQIKIVPTPEPSATPAETE
jgi:DNA/RNA endonuclease YhcR with UshA esterase domain